MEQTLFVGTYTGGSSEGLYTCGWEDAAPKLSIRSVAKCANPAYLTKSADGSTLYTVLELKQYGGAPGGGVAAFQIREEGMLSPLGEQATGGVFPCHLALSPNGGHLFVANYGSGSVSVYPVKRNGALGTMSGQIIHQGSGPNPQRQEGPHCHFAAIAPDGRHLLINDLGLDTVFLYPLSEEKGLRGEPTHTATASGGGPRHAVFSPDGRHAYVLLEMGNQVEAYAYASDEPMRRLQSISTLPADFSGESTTAAIRISADGRHLYASNRGHDSVAAYAIGQDGRLTLLNITPTGGRTPRDIQLTPQGDWLLCANQDSDRITALSVEADGSLKEQGLSWDVPSPVCLLF